MDRLDKRIIAVIHKVALLRTEVSTLQKANEELSKRRRAKKNTCIAWRVTYCTGGIGFTRLEGCG